MQLYFSINQNDFSIVLGNLRIGQSTINTFFEYLKGYESEWKIASNLIAQQNILQKDKITYSRITNIQYLSDLANETNNLSLITPNDYDDIIVECDYNYKYSNAFLKYYSYSFNFNNFPNNSKVIYTKLYEYFVNVSNNSYCIKNIKNYNIKLYNKLFFNIFYCYIGYTYYNTTYDDIASLHDTKNDTLLTQLNVLLKLYFKYNYSFRINNDISNVNNLLIQNYFQITNLHDSFMNYDKIITYSTNYYYYQLFSHIYYTDTDSDAFKINSKYTFTNDLINFINTLNNETNVNFFYDKNYFNILFKTEIIIKLAIYKLNSVYKLNIKVNENKFIELNNKLNNYFCDKFKISKEYNSLLIFLLNLYL
jgi:hypothetical protein